MSRLAARFDRNAFGVNSDSPLSNDQLFRVAPSIFAENAHNSRSERYTYIPTIEVLDGLRKEGFQPFMAAQSRSRIEGKSDYTKHMLRLRQADQVNAAEAFEIILINSHDGTSSYQMLAGVFRFVCRNGMVAGDVVEEIRVPHRGNITDNVINAAYSIVDQFTDVQGSIEKLKGTELTGPEAEIFAKAALSLRYDEAPIQPARVLMPRRSEDKGTSAWSAFNRIQENMLKGGQPGVTTTGKRTRTREVTSIDNNVKLNKALWILAEEMAALKGN